MPKNHTIRSRVSKSQLEVINNKAKSQGYLCLSHYLRDLGLNSRKVVNGKIMSINKNVQGMLEIMKNGG